MEKSLLSQAQADLAETDSANMGMPVDEILMARGWVKEEILEEYAPLLKDEEKPKARVTSGLSYDENLKVYRDILGEILGESSE